MVMSTLLQSSEVVMTVHEGRWSRELTCSQVDYANFVYGPVTQNGFLSLQSVSRQRSIALIGRSHPPTHRSTNEHLHYSGRVPRDC